LQFRLEKSYGEKGLDDLCFSVAAFNSLKREFSPQYLIIDWYFACEFKAK